VILPDTSVWVEYLRAPGSFGHQRLRTLLSEEQPVATTEIVIMELLAGANDAADAAGLRRLLYRCELLAVGGLGTYEHAAAIYRACRQGGETVRKMTDCVIAAVALRTDATVLHRDVGFDVIARHTALRIDPA